MTTPRNAPLSRGTVVLVPFPFTDLSTSKNRPAVVLSTAVLNASSSDVLIVQLTGNTQRTAMGDYVLNDWQAAGLRKASVARAKLATVKTSLIVRIIGHLSILDLAGVEATVKQALGL